MRPALLTDLYELMMVAYVGRGKDDPATFELSIRALPTGPAPRGPERATSREAGGWGCYLANGIEDALDCLAGLQFGSRELVFLERKELFRRSFLDFLARFKFEGEAQAVREGTPVFPGEPLLRVTARRTQAQLVETALLNAITNTRLTPWSRRATKKSPASPC